MTRRVTKSQVERLHPTSAFVEAENLVRVSCILTRQAVAANRIPQAYSAPVAVQLELTSRCNLRCLHCYNASGCEPLQSGSCLQELSVGEWLKLVRSLSDLGVFSVIISGGEPTLLGDGLCQIIDLLGVYGIAVSLITNGLSLSGSQLAALRAVRPTWVQVSIDGHEAGLHDHFRGRAGSWRRAAVTALRISEERIPLHIAHTVWPGNVGFLLQVADLAYLLGAQRLVAGAVNLSGRALENGRELMLSASQEREFDFLFRQVFVEFAGRMEVNVGMTTPQTLRTLCSGPLSSVVVRPDGTVRMDCCAPFALGNVRKESLEDIWSRTGARAAQDPRVRRYVDRIRTERDVLAASPRPFVDPDIEL